MEFFAIARVQARAEDLQSLPLEHLHSLCPSIERVLQVDDDDHARVWTVWGEFDLSRQAIQGGARFTLPQCANSLSWTLSTGNPPAPEHVVIHATINRTGQDPDFVETLEEFVAQWREGLERQWQAARAPSPTLPRDAGEGVR
ncbi:MAG: hypothetical protein ABR558_07030 [Thioalkalivibrio sp.]